MIKSQMIRPSQFILTYGPGAILEGPNGPRIVPGLQEGLLRSIALDDLEIADRSMSEAVLDGKKIFEMPSNSRLGYASGTYLYRTGPFPRWKMCMNASKHKGANLLYMDSSRYGPALCPVCKDGRNPPRAIRFVRACPDGHMDEVPWSYMVHGDGRCDGWARDGIRPAPASGNDTFYYRSRGPISSVELECTRCAAMARLGDWYNRLPCSGRHPESEPPGSNQPRTSKCGATSRIIPRGASNLRIPVVETHFTTRPFSTNIHDYMSDKTIAAALFAVQPPPRTKKEVLDRLKWSAERGDIPENVMNEIHLSSWEVLKDAIDSAQEKPAGGFMEMITGEFRGLEYAAKNGAPPLRPPNEERVLFEVERGSTNTVRNLRVTPVRRLRTVTVQTGYRRMITTSKSADKPAEPEPVDISFEYNGSWWYPGVMFFGEGIFITSPKTVLDADARAARRWSEAESAGYNPHIFQHESFRELNPVFVWWHTLAHALIRAIGEHAGYSSASIRERVYTDKSRGGILLYTTQPGNDGTLGGLVSLVPFFEPMLDAAMERVYSCSGDPLCDRQEFAQGGLNGAACYGCVMNSETSCEHRNMWLDRHVLRESRP